MKKAVQTHMQHPEQRDFPLESVERTHGYAVELVSEFLALSLHEMTKRFGHAPRQKDPKITKVTFGNQQQQQEQLWVFKEPNSHRPQTSTSDQSRGQ